MLFSTSISTTGVECGFCDSHIGQYCSLAAILENGCHGRHGTNSECLRSLKWPLWCLVWVCQVSCFYHKVHDFSVICWTNNGCNYLSNAFRITNPLLGTTTGHQYSQWHAFICPQVPSVTPWSAVLTLPSWTLRATPATIPSKFCWWTSTCPLLFIVARTDSLRNSRFTSARK